jgi:hypothetical protein
LCRFAFFSVEIVDVKEQRVRIKFYFKLSKRVAETQNMIKQAFGDDALAQPQIYNWFNRFKNGRMSVDDDERSGRTSIGIMAKYVAKVHEVIREDRRPTIHDVCNIVGLS